MNLDHKQSSFNFRKELLTVHYNLAILVPIIWQMAQVLEQANLIRHNIPFYTHTHTLTHSLTYTIHTLTHKCVHIHTYTHTLTQVYTHTNACTCTHTHTHTHTYSDTHTHTHTHSHMHILTYTHTSTLTHTLTCTHTKKTSSYPCIYSHQVERYPPQVIQLLPSRTVKMTYMYHIFPHSNLTVT